MIIYFKNKDYLFFFVLIVFSGRLLFTYLWYVVRCFKCHTRKDNYIKLWRLRLWDPSH
jgi:hypothetical protein